MAHDHDDWQVIWVGGNLLGPYPDGYYLCEGCGAHVYQDLDRWGSPIWKTMA